MWQVIGRGRKNDGFTIAGFEVWRHGWQALDESPSGVWDPVYGGVIEVHAYRISGGDREVVFGAAEVSPDSWLFCGRALPGC